ncbi:SufE family protein [Lolliginicoccus levis]|uniref:SufE family protein n=1 Tax=Lolliginicoccus levis TaxID=2919542 RepID=UPI00241F5008|nr:SufE family protein [Lolliginicoccus levis]
MTGSTVPGSLQEIIDDFQAMEGEERVQLLLEFSRELPPLPPELEEAAMEPVPECQSPLFLSVDATDRAAVVLHFSAPQEAPTTRGFASILHQGLDGLSADEILGVPDDFYLQLGLESIVSPLRLRGMSAMLTRVKRRVREG